MRNTPVRVRFAPSPTGRLHIGNVRTALLNWLCARHFNGKFILRIEDTDAERSTEESERGIIDQLQWLGIDWDEGPQKGGQYAPYRQSERRFFYAAFISRLIAEEKAYYCFCSREELAAARERALAEKREVVYSGKCRNLTAEQAEAYRKEGRRPVVRFRVPGGKVTLRDIVQGDIIFDAATISDFVIQRENGSSPYNFAAVVDDAAMEITHVIRGNDHVSNTPKQIMLYEALGFPLPAFAHIPMITGRDGVRLSKRHGHTSVEEFRAAGYLPAALINYLSLLSWSSESGDEILSVERLIREFDLSRVSKSPAQFDLVKLNWLNGHYLRALSPEERVRHAQPFLERAGMSESDPARLTKIVEAVKDRVETLSEFPRYAELFFNDTVVIDGGEELEIIRREDSQKIFTLLRRYLAELEELTIPDFQAVMKRIQQETGVRGKNLWLPVRTALTGQMHGPELPVVLEIFGRDRCLRQLEAVAEERYRR